MLAHSGYALPLLAVIFDSNRQPLADPIRLPHMLLAVAALAIAGAFLAGALGLIRETQSVRSGLGLVCVYLWVVLSMYMCVR